MSGAHIALLVFLLQVGIGWGYLVTNGLLTVLRERRNEKEARQKIQTQLQNEVGQNRLV